MSSVIEPKTEGEGDFLLTKSVTFNNPAKIASYASNEGFVTKVWGQKAAPTTKVSESLDYEAPQNKLFYERMNAKGGKKKLWGYTGHTMAKFLVTFAVGVITGCFAVALSKCVSILISSKLLFIQNQMTLYEEDPAMAAFIGLLWFVLFGGIMVSIATSMVQYWAPASAGAGVTLVMAYLNGNHIPNLLRFSTLITKFVGTVFAVSSGLPMGPEGPMVHIGACVASVITYMDFKYLTSGKLFGRLKVKEVAIKERLKVLDEIVSDSDHREFVSAGVSAGIAAAFAAPIGGVLFSMEEACTFWSKKTAWRCFICGALSVYTVQIINPALGDGAIPLSNMTPLTIREWAEQLPFLLVDFAMAGLLGAAFNSLRMWLWKVRAAKTLHLQRIAEVIGLVFLVGSCAFFFASTAGKCLELPPTWEEDGYGVRFLCPEGQHNDLATLFLSNTHETIIALFSMGKGSAVPGSETFVPYFSIGSLALYTACYVVLMSIGAGLAIPGGLFMPSIVVGGCWGGMWGYVIKDLIPSWKVQPGIYGMLAATGVLGSVFRSAISLVVLMVEGTRGVDYIFGIILAVVVANYVANFIHHDGVYESELERVGNVYMLQSDPPSRLNTLTTESIMATGVKGFRPIESLVALLEVLATTSHNGFPVWSEGSDVESADLKTEGSASEDEGCRRLEGIITRSQLLVLLQRRHFVDAHGNPVGREFSEGYELELETEMRTFFRRYYTHCRYISATRQPLESLSLDNGGLAAVDLNSLYLDLRPYMNRSPVTVRKECAASRAHQVFVNLNMRHLFVVDSHNHVVGLITRKDLDHAAGHGWWRMSHQAEPPRNKMVLQIMKFPTSGVTFFKNLVGSSKGGSHSEHASGNHMSVVTDNGTSNLDQQHH